MNLAPRHGARHVVLRPSLSHVGQNKPPNAFPMQVYAACEGIVARHGAADAIVVCAGGRVAGGGQ